MNEETAKRIDQRFRKLEREGVRYRQGVVTDDSPLSVALGGSDTPYTGVVALDASILKVGDTVATLTFGNDLIVLGRTGSGGDPWHAPTLLNGFANYAGREAAGYRKTADGKVHLKGTVNVASAKAANTAIFALPVGFRPPAEQWFKPYFGNSGAVATNERLEISSGGNVNIPFAIASGTSVSLDGISFFTS